MRLRISSHFIVLLLAALPLAGCFSRNEPPPLAGAELTQDDDMYCRAGGKVAVGTPDYVYCRKERDAQRNGAAARADRKQQDLAEWHGFAEGANAGAASAVTAAAPVP